MIYRIALAPTAARQLRTFDPPVRRRIQAVREWRVRTGDYRIVNEIEEDQLLVLVLRVVHRRDVHHIK